MAICSKRSGPFQAFLRSWESVLRRGLALLPLFFVFSFSCKLQKSKLRSSEGGVDSTVPPPKVLKGSFSVKYASKSKSSAATAGGSGSKVNSVVTAPSSYPIHYTFLIQFSDDGKHAQFSSCLDSDGDAAKLEGANLTSDSKLALLEVLRFEGQTPTSAPTFPSASENVTCAKDGYGAEVSAKLFLAAKENAPNSNAPEKVPGGEATGGQPAGGQATGGQNSSAPSSGSNGSGSSATSVPGNTLKFLDPIPTAGKSDGKETKPKVTIGLRANSEGWELDSFNYFGYEALVEQVFQN